MKNILFFAILLLTSATVFGQTKYMTRTGHIQVEAGNNVKDIVADNYQVASVLDTKSGAINFTGLIKSFEFQLGAVNRMFNSRQLNVTENPKIKYEGKVTNLTAINFSQPGTYPIEVEGILYIWDEKRITPAKGQVTVNADGTLSGKADLMIFIEPQSVKKVNDLMKERLPSIVSVDVNSLGITRKILIKAEMDYQAR
ncbi:MAG: hypothetical protein AB8G22_11090 [Saprospiraceae bacterium]